MSKPTTYRVGFKINHPTLPAKVIEDATEGAPVFSRFSRSVGQPRMTRRGMPLEGNYETTNVSFTIHQKVIEHNDTPVEEFIESQFTWLPLSLIDQVTSSGGKCFFTIGIFCEKNMMCWIGPSLLSKLSNHKIGLSFDFYGGPDD